MSEVTHINNKNAFYNLQVTANLLDFYLTTKIIPIINAHYNNKYRLFVICVGLLFFKTPINIVIRV